MRARKKPTSPTQPANPSQVDVTLAAIEGLAAAKASANTHLGGKGGQHHHRGGGPLPDDREVSHIVAISDDTSDKRSEANSGNTREALKVATTVRAPRHCSASTRGAPRSMKPSAGVHADANA